MEINWFTVVAQLVNFAVLLVILRFVLFKRIVAAIDDRRARIEAEKRAAQEAGSSTKAELEQARRQRAELAERREQLLLEARTEAEQRRNELEAEARAQVERLRERLQAQLDDEQSELLTSLLHTAIGGVGEASARALTELSGADFDRRMVERLCRRLREADEDERAELAQAWAELDEPLVISSSRELEEAEREQLGAAIRAALPEAATPKLSFERSQTIVCGIEISGGGRSLGWSIDSYLSALEHELQTALEQQLERDASDELAADEPNADDEPEPQSAHA